MEEIETTAHQNDDRINALKLELQAKDKQFEQTLKEMNAMKEEYESKLKASKEAMESLSKSDLYEQKMRTLTRIREENNELQAIINGDIEDEFALDDNQFVIRVATIKLESEMIKSKIRDRYRAIEEQQMEVSEQCVVSPTASLQKTTEEESESAPKPMADSDTSETAPQKPYWMLLNSVLEEKKKSGTDEREIDSMVSQPSTGGPIRDTPVNDSSLFANNFDEQSNDGQENDSEFRLDFMRSPDNTNDPPFILF